MKNYHSLFHIIRLGISLLIDLAVRMFTAFIGISMINAGIALSSTIIGVIIGIPLIVLGFLFIVMSIFNGVPIVVYHVEPAPGV